MTIIMMVAGDGDEMNDEDRFIPLTMERDIGRGVVFRPIRSWHSLTYAGERLETMPGTKDRSGCMRPDGGVTPTCSIPYSVTHRLYWNKKNPDVTISVFLSYPSGMGACDRYFWEVYGKGIEDCERFFSETEMEQKILEVLGD